MKTLISSNSVFMYKRQIDSHITGSLADKRQVIAIITPPILIAFMYPIFQLLAGSIENDRTA
jgi:hypothetical protein